MKSFMLAVSAGDILAPEMASQIFMVVVVDQPLQLWRAEAVETDGVRGGVGDEVLVRDNLHGVG